MKVKPIKMLSGGGMPPFTIYQPFIAPDTSAASESTTTKASSSSKDTDKTKGVIDMDDYAKMVNALDGLPSDINNLFKSIRRFSDLLSLRSLGASDSGINSSALQSMYFSTLQKVKIAKFNKELYDAALKLVTKNGGLSEIAITPFGKVVALNKEGELTLLSPKEYLNNSDKYMALTNSNLLSLRANNSDFAFSNDILGVVENGIGMGTINELINSAVELLGTLTETTSGYALKKGNDILKGLELLQRIGGEAEASKSMTLDGIYKTKVITKSLYESAKRALAYVYQALPENARTLLKIKSSNADNPEKGAYDLLSNIIMTRADYSADFDVDLLEDLNEDGTKKSSKKEEKDENPLDKIKVNAAAKLVMGVGTPGLITINPGGTLAIQTAGTSLKLNNAESKNLGTMSTLLQVTLGEFGSVLDVSNASMGMKRITPEKFGLVVITDGVVNTVDYPYTVVNNTIVPDLSKETQAAKESADSDLRAAGVDITNKESRMQNYDLINKTYEKYGLLAAYKPDGTPADGWARFAVMNADASSRVLGDIDGNNLLQNIEDEDLINSIIKVSGEEDFDFKNWYDRFFYDKMFKGTVWLPLDTNMATALANEDLTAEQVHAIEELRLRKASNLKVTDEVE